jgi:predicted alpha/beta superfamily hydrolase
MSRVFAIHPEARPVAGGFDMWNDSIPVHQGLRRLDYTPTRMLPDSTSGGADEFLTFLRDVAIPLIGREAQLRVGGGGPYSATPVSVFS